MVVILPVALLLLYNLCVLPQQNELRCTGNMSSGRPEAGRGHAGNRRGDHEKREDEMRGGKRPKKTLSTLELRPEELRFAHTYDKQNKFCNLFVSTALYIASVCL